MDIPQIPNSDQSNGFIIDTPDNNNDPTRQPCYTSTTPNLLSELNDNNNMSNGGEDKVITEYEYTARNRSLAFVYETNEYVSNGEDDQRMSIELDDVTHITSECSRLESAIRSDSLLRSDSIHEERIGCNEERSKFIQKYFGQLLELPQLLLNKSQLDITCLIQFSKKLEKFPPPLKAKLGDIFPTSTFTILKAFLENLGLNLQQCIWVLFERELPDEEFNCLVNSVLQNYCETLCPNFKLWSTFSAAKKYETVLETDYIKILTVGPVLFADFYGRVFEDIVSSLRDNEQKTDLQNLLEDYIVQSKRKKSIKDDLAATWQMIVQFLLLFKGAYSNLKKISPDVVSEETLQCVHNVCSYFEIFTELTNLISALSVGFKTSESMIDHIKGWSSEQLTDIMKTPKAFIQSIHPQFLEFYPVPHKKDKIRDSKATLYLFSDRLVIKISKEGFSSQFLRGLGYHLPDITIYSLKDIKNIQFEKAPPHILDNYSVPSNVPVPMVLRADVLDRRMEVVFKSGPDVPDQDKQSAQFVGFLSRLKDLSEYDLYQKCTGLIAPSSLQLLNEIARSWFRMRELEKVPQPLLSENPGLLGEVPVEKFTTISNLGKHRSTELGRKGVKGCKGIRMFIFTDSIFVTLVGQTVGITNYTIWQYDVSKFIFDMKGTTSLYLESEKLNKSFRLYPDMPKGPAGVENKIVRDIKHYVHCFNEIQFMRETQEQKLKELNVHAKDPELKPNKR